VECSLVTVRDRSYMSMKQRRDIGKQPSDERSKKTSQGPGTSGIRVPRISGRTGGESTPGLRPRQESRNRPILGRIPTPVPHVTKATPVIIEDQSFENLRWRRKKRTFPPRLFKRALLIAVNKRSSRGIVRRPRNNEICSPGSSDHADTAVLLQVTYQ